jgi:hypothetical protein
MYRGTAALVAVVVSIYATVHYCARNMRRGANEAAHSTCQG